MPTKKLQKDDAIKANIYVHSFLANSGEYNKSPHFNKENQEKVRNILLYLTKNMQGYNQEVNKVIDFGCGTGFMINLMHDLFNEVHGVDITRDMMKQVDLSPNNIYLHETIAENTSFECDMFDFATAYSFMDHLLDYKVFLKEVYRVLRPGGVFYSDLNPNRGFIHAIGDAEKLLGRQSKFSEIVKREIQGATRNGEYYHEKFGIDGELLEMAEPVKTIDEGFDSQEVISVASEIGFSECKVENEWF